VLLADSVEESQRQQALAFSLTQSPVFTIFNMLVGY